MIGSRSAARIISALRFSENVLPPAPCVVVGGGVGVGCAWACATTLRQTLMVMICVIVSIDCLSLRARMVFLLDIGMGILRSGQYLLSALCNSSIELLKSVQA